jgi:1,4-alpha-glucan branching enzyme
VTDLNHLYKNEPALHEQDFSNEGFEWIDCHDWEESSVSFIRKCHSTNEIILVVCNFTPVIRENYRIGVPKAGYWKEILNSDSTIYSGSGCGNAGGVTAEAVPSQGREFSLSLKLPPLGILFFKR